MKRIAYVGLLLLSWLPAVALANIELARAKECMLCHALEGKLIGPAFKEIAGRYASRNDMEDRLTKKVMQGGGGAWGNYRMPANTGVSEAEAHTLVKWVLELK